MPKTAHASASRKRERRPQAAFGRSRWALTCSAPHPFHGGLDLFVGQGRVAALGRHHPGAAGEPGDRLADQLVDALLGQARADPGRVQLRRAADAGGMAAGAGAVVEDLGTVCAAIERDVGQQGCLRGGRGGGLCCGTGRAGIHVTGRGDARQQTLVGGRVHVMHDLGVQVVREQDQAQGDQRQEGEDHREALEEFKVVVAHDPPGSGVWPKPPNPGLSQNSRCSARLPVRRPRACAVAKVNMCRKPVLQGLAQGEPGARIQVDSNVSCVKVSIDTKSRDGHN